MTIIQGIILIIVAPLAIYFILEIIPNWGYRRK